MESFKSVSQKALEEQDKGNEQIMFEITNAQFENDRDLFDQLDDNDKVLVNRYYSVKSSIREIEERIQRLVDQGGMIDGRVSLQTRQREALVETEKEIREALKSRPDLHDFLRYHEEQKQLRNPENPSLN